MSNFVKRAGIIKRGGFLQYQPKDNRWCFIHPGGFWGINPQTNEPYKRCSKGHQKNENCKMMIGENAA